MLFSESKAADAKLALRLSYTLGVVNAFVKISDLLAQAASDHIIVTPNERLARELRRGFNQRQQQCGNQAWLTTQCLSLNQFLTSEFTNWQDHSNDLRQLLPASALLSRFYQSATPTQRHLSTSAAQAQELLYRYDIDLEQLESNDTQSQMFVEWARRVFAMQTAEELYPAELAKFLTTENYLPSKPLLLIAFDHLSITEQQYLMTAYATSGVAYWSEQDEMLDFAVAFSDVAKSFTKSIDPPRVKPRLYGFDSLAEELAGAAAWAADICRQQPEARVAVVVPQLSKHYLRVQRQFAVTLDPSQGSATRCFDLSGGTPLNTQPAWTHALVFLTWCSKPADQTTIENVAFSPFLNAPWSHQALKNWIPGQRHLALSALAKEPSAGLLLKHLSQAPLHASFGFWLTHIEALLSVVDWPCIGDLESSQFQAVAQIRETINALARQHTGDEEPTTYEGALELLDLHLQNRVFAPQRPASQVQILGLLETTGLEYSHLWVSGMDANSFPQSAQHNPFIPTRIAQQHRLPRITPNQELEFSNRILSQWLQSGADICFSYVRMQDAYEVLPSLPVTAVAELIPTNASARANLSQYHPYLQANDVPLEQFEDWSGTPLPDGLVQGGSGILQDQLECPFRSYACHRLGIRQDREPSDFPDALERGIVLHSVMQLLGNRCSTSEQLVALTSEEIYAACEHVLMQRRPLPTSFVANECARLSALIEQWIAIEQLRFPFSIDATEQNYQLNLEGLTFNLRVDRIDRQQETLTIFDYKTSSRTINGATKSPPTDLQLPIYSLLDPDISNVVYACIGDKEVKATGIGEQPLDSANKGELKIHSPKISWTEQREQWRQTLSELARSIQQGDARVTPQKNACRYCHLQSFCRINAENEDESVDEPFNA